MQTISEFLFSAASPSSVKEGMDQSLEWPSPKEGFASPNGSKPQQGSGSTPRHAKDFPSPKHGKKATDGSHESPATEDNPESPLLVGIGLSTPTHAKDLPSPKSNKEQQAPAGNRTSPADHSYSSLRSSKQFLPAWRKKSHGEIERLKHKKQEGESAIGRRAIGT
jgi:hypothetical protein